jgi:Secretion system C-terminal sorting domain
MKNHLSFIISISLCLSSTFAQVKYDYNWMFGDSYPPSNKDTCYGGVQIDFNNNVITKRRQDIVGSMESINTSISHPTTGKLLFYTNSCFLMDASHKKMKGSDSLNFGGTAFEILCPQNFGAIETQGYIFLPVPNQQDKYIIFHSIRLLKPGPDSSWLNTTMVDMSKNGGLGEVVEKRKLLLAVGVQDDHIAAIKHGNGRDWWIVFQKENSDIYYRILLTPKGIENILTQKIGKIEPPGGGAGQTVFSLDGKKFVSYDPENGIRLYDFDRCTGLLSNPIYLSIKNTIKAESGCEFSPNSRFLYVTKSYELWQYDLIAENIENSKIRIDTLDVTKKDQVTGKYSFDLCQLAPNGKIYIEGSGSNKILHTIHQPNEKGNACNFKQADFSLLVYSYTSLPYFPRYRMSAWDGSPCDTLGINDPNPPLQENPDLAVKIYPNPVESTLNIELNGATSDLVFEIYDILGRKIRTKKLSSDYRFFQIDLEEVIAGSYIWILTDGKKILKNGKLIRHRE